MTAGWFHAVCVDCTPVMALPFRNEDERDVWAIGHGDTTGHKVMRTAEGPERLGNTIRIEDPYVVGGYEPHGVQFRYRGLTVTFTDVSDTTPEAFDEALRTFVRTVYGWTPQRDTTNN